MEILLKINPKTPIESNVIKESLEQLSKLDTDTLKKLADLSKNETALKVFKNPPVALKIALGI